MIYEYWLAGIQGITSKSKMKLRSYIGEGKDIYNIEERKIKNLDFLRERERYALLSAVRENDLERKYKKIEEQQILFIPYFSQEFPEKLKNIPSAPYALYIKGRLPERDRPTIAIVGARNSTSYGEALAIEYGQELAKNGVQIISGMARGIDGAGHRGALNAGGNTYSVLGCGPDICYPKEHKGLYEDILKSGGIISEYIPGTPPLPSNFPARNRIISGLSDAILVMEAKEKSGSLITADMALEQGKDVYALPGSVKSCLSIGCHRLISQGAGILISPSDLLKEMNIFNEKLEQNSYEIKKELETPQNIVYSRLDLYPKGLEELIAETGLDSRRIIKDLISLELEGKVKEISKNHYIRNG